MFTARSQQAWCTQTVFCFLRVHSWLAVTMCLSRWAEQCYRQTRSSEVLDMGARGKKTTCSFWNLTGKVTISKMAPLYRSIINFTARGRRFEMFRELELKYDFFISELDMLWETTWTNNKLNTVSSRFFCNYGGSFDAVWSYYQT